MQIKTPWAGAMAIAAVLAFGTALDAGLSGPSDHQAAVDVAADLQHAQAQAQAEANTDALAGSLKAGQANQAALWNAINSHLGRLNVLADGQAQALDALMRDAQALCVARHGPQVEAKLDLAGGKLLCSTRRKTTLAGVM